MCNLFGFWKRDLCSLRRAPLPCTWLNSMHDQTPNVRIRIYAVVLKESKNVEWRAFIMLYSLILMFPNYAITAVAVCRRYHTALLLISCLPDHRCRQDLLPTTYNAARLAKEQCHHLAALLAEPTAS